MPNTLSFVNIEQIHSTFETQLLTEKICSRIGSGLLIAKILLQEFGNHLLFSAGEKQPATLVAEFNIQNKPS